MCVYSSFHGYDHIIFLTRDQFQKPKKPRFPKPRAWWVFAPSIRKPSNSARQFTSVLFIPQYPSLFLHPFSHSSHKNKPPVRDMAASFSSPLPFTTFSLLLFFLIASALARHSKSNPAGRKGGGGTCDFFHGSWVYDASFPIYDSGGCPYIDPEFNCQKYGRPDTDYLKYRWQPSACDLPR